jgi:hypothetical protein
MMLKTRLQVVTYDPPQPPERIHTKLSATLTRLLRIEERLPWAEVLPAWVSKQNAWRRDTNNILHGNLYPRSQQLEVTRAVVLRLVESLSDTARQRLDARYPYFLEDLPGHVSRSGEKDLLQLVQTFKTAVELCWEEPPPGKYGPRSR